MKISLFLSLSIIVSSCADPKYFPGDSRASELGSTADLGAVELYIPQMATVKGKVLAPQGKMPVSGALVYVTTKPPPEIPDHVFCDKCVELTMGTPNTTSAPDGTFTLKVVPGTYQLVTQKGAFRRVRNIQVPAEGLTVPEALTTLPFRTDAAAGDNIPKMLVIEQTWDAIQNSLAKLGLGKVDNRGVLIRGTESFTIPTCKILSLIPPVTECVPIDPCAVLQKLEEISKYHIVFVPCGGDDMNSCFSSPAAKTAVKEYVKAGGRLYVTDWHYDLIQQVFPGYIHWVGESNELDTAQLMNDYDTPAIVDDPDLKAWLAAQGQTSFELLDSYTIIDNIAKQPTPGPDAKSNKVYNLGPYTWMSGNVPQHGVKPMTVTFPFGCGKVLFSTYHTEGEQSAVDPLPQERALLYIILEVAVCMKDPVPE